MKEKTYETKVVKLEEDFKIKKRQLDLDYALSNRVAEAGDIIKSGSFCIEVSAMSLFYPFGNRNPTLIYSGPRLTKSLKPFKDGSYESVYGSNPIEKIGAK